MILMSSWRGSRQVEASKGIPGGSAQLPMSCLDKIATGRAGTDKNGEADLEGDPGSSPVVFCPELLRL